MNKNVFFKYAVILASGLFIGAVGVKADEPRPADRPAECSDSLLDAVVAAKSNPDKFSLLKSDYRGVQKLFKGINKAVSDKAGIVRRLDVTKFQRKIDAASIQLAAQNALIAAANQETVVCGADEKCKKLANKKFQGASKKATTLNNLIARLKGKIQTTNTRKAERLAAKDGQIASKKTSAAALCVSMSKALQSSANSAPKAVFTVTKSCSSSTGGVAYIVLTGSYTDSDANLSTATIRVLGAGDLNGNLGEFPATGQANEPLSNGSAATITRPYYMPYGEASSGKYWFRTEVFDTAGASDVKWVSVDMACK